MSEDINPLVSIIMPVHDCMEYLSDSLNSLCSQTYTNLEIIVVDTSTDNKVYELVSRINDDRIRMIRLESAVGLTCAFAEGLSNSKGVFISRHDPDDISSPTRIEMQVNHLLNNEGVDMVSCLIRCITDESSYRNACTFIEKIHNQYTSFEGISHAILNNFVPIVFPTLLIRRELLSKLTIPYQPLGFDDQLDLLLNLIKKGHVEKIDMLLYSYRRHKNAYHIVNNLEYQKYCTNTLQSSDIKNYLRYKSFYDEFKACNISQVKANSESSLRILMLVDALNIGGTETHVLNLVRKLMELGAYVVVGTSGGPLTYMFEAYGIKVCHIPFSSDNISNKDIFSLLKHVKNILDTEQINLIHAHLFASMRMGSEISKIYGIPYITTIHGLFYPKDILFKTCFNAARIIAVSEPVKKSLLTNLGTRMNDLVKVLPNGVYLDDMDMRSDQSHIRKKYNIPEDHLLVTYCSRLAWGKTNAAENFVFSIFKMAQSHDKIHAFIIGDGDGKEIVKKEAEMINSILMDEKIHVLGAIFNVEDYFSESDVVVGTGRVALEAMSLGKPVIAIGNQGYMGIIDPGSQEVQWNLYFGDHGRLDNINVNKLADDLKYLAEHPEKRCELGQWSKNWCEDMFNIDKIVRNTMDIYKELLAANGDYTIG